MTLSCVGKKRRMDRLFTNGKIMVVPIDDSVILGPKDGLFNLEKTISSVVQANPSALMGYRLGLEYASIHGSNIPFIYNISASTLLGIHTKKMLIQSVENALIAGADCVAVHINFSSSYENEMLRNFSIIANDCDRMGVPLLAIAYPRSEKDGKDYNYEDLLISNNEEYTALVSHCVRIVIEMGADIVKTQYTGSAESFKFVTDSAGSVPIITAGGPKIAVKDSLACVYGAMKGGASGISFGRNVFNADNVSAYVNAAKSIIFKNATLEDVMRQYENNLRR